ncbi:MAG: hypothetical protein LBG59_01340 [Candidatus Peribacteria bacterium]|nr:hypothetical protein [Candidatus Peribacteria bacterium]
MFIRLSRCGVAKERQEVVSVQVVTGSCSLFCWISCSPSSIGNITTSCSIS